MRAAIILLVFATAARAQGVAADSSSHIFLSLWLGDGSIASFDDLGSPIPYKAHAAPIAGRIEYVTMRARHTLEASGIIAGINAANMVAYHGGKSDYNIPYLYYALNYRFVRSLRDWFDPRLHLSIGGEWSNFYFYRDYIGSNQSFDAASSFGPAAALQYDVSDRQQIYTSLAVPIITLLVRPPFDFVGGNVFDFADAHVRVIGQMFAARAQVGYNYAISQLFMLGAAYHLQYYHYPLFYWRTDGALSDVSLGVTWRFAL